jgi:hypothetical protein
MQIINKSYASYLNTNPYWIEEYGLLNTHKYLLLENIAWLMDKYMSIDR